MPPYRASLSSGGLARPKDGRIAKKVGPRGPERSLPLVWLSLGLLLSLVLFELVGFVLSSSVLFWMVARSFRSERPIRDAGVALALSTLVYFTFTRESRTRIAHGRFGLVVLIHSTCRAEALAFVKTSADRLAKAGEEAKRWV